jgi:hypothetical protein
MKTFSFTSSDMGLIITGLEKLKKCDDTLNDQGKQNLDTLLSMIREEVPGTRIKIDDLIKRGFTLCTDGTWSKAVNDVAVNLQNGIIRIQSLALLSTLIKFENSITHISEIDIICNLVLPKTQAIKS